MVWYTKIYTYINEYWIGVQYSKTVTINNDGTNRPTTTRRPELQQLRVEAAFQVQPSELNNIAWWGKGESACERGECPMRLRILKL